MLARSVGVIAGVGLAAILVSRFIVVADATSLDQPAAIERSMAGDQDPSANGKHRAPDAAGSGRTPPTALVVSGDEAFSAPQRCYRLGHQKTGLLASELLQLCEGAPTSNGPVDCYLSAEEQNINPEVQRLSLCRCAGSVEPVECFVRMRSETNLFDYQIEQLCAPQQVYELLPNCLPIGGWR